MCERSYSRALLAFVDYKKAVDEGASSEDDEEGGAIAEVDESEGEGTGEGTAAGGDDAALLLQTADGLLDAAITVNPYAGAKPRPQPFLLNRVVVGFRFLCALWSLVCCTHTHPCGRVYPPEPLCVVAWRCLEVRCGRAGGGRRLHLARGTRGPRRREWPRVCGHASVWVCARMRECMGACVSVWVHV